jgi:hypothetical protein
MEKPFLPLTKSRFKLALECPAKLSYCTDKSYANQKQDDPFLKALAGGGYQVGELAKIYFEGGNTEIEKIKDYKTSVEATNRELQKQECVIYEAAFSYEGLFVRADIIKKINNHY